MSAREKIAYLRGLIDGQKVADTPEKEKFFAALVDTLDSLAGAMEDHEEVHQELNDYLEQLDEDVSELEDELEALIEDEYDEEDEDDYEDFDEEEYASVTCPECGKDFYYEPAAYDEDEDLLCPHCGKPFKHTED